MSQAQEVQEQYESVQEYHQISSSEEQHVYAYEQTPGIITIANQPQTIQTASIQIKRDIIIDKDNIVNGNNEPSISVVNSEAHAVYVELKQNENLEHPRYVTNVRYEGPERYHRYTYAHPLPSHLAQQREAAMKDAEAAQQQQHHLHHQQQQQHQQEIHIYESEQQQQQQNQHLQQQQQQQSSEQQSEQQQQQPNESKTHYTNLEPVPSQNSYYITSENYQSSNGNFTYLQAPTTKEGYVYHHPAGSPVMYKSNCFSNISHSL